MALEDTMSTVHWAGQDQNYGLCHRLDRETSGAPNKSWEPPCLALGTVLVGITQKSRTQMRECFHRHYVRKLPHRHVWSRMCSHSPCIPLAFACQVCLFGARSGLLEALAVGMRFRGQSGANGGPQPGGDGAEGEVGSPGEEGADSREGAII